MSYKFPAGMVNWRFTHTDRMVYKTKNLDASRYYYAFRDREQFKVEANGIEGWFFVIENIPRDICHCGRSYTLDNGEPFKYQEAPLVTNMKNVVAMMRSPLLCQVCYYRTEITNGRWAPKSVRRELGLED